MSQSIAVLPGKVFHGKPATDYQTTESDAGANQTITTLTDNYIQFPASTGPIVNIGFASTDSNGVTLDVQYLSGNGQIGEVPLSSGWSNDASTVISETDPDGTTISENIAADGSYSLTKTEFAGTTSATQKSDGTGTATIPFRGFFGVGSGTTITIPAQSGGVINFTLTAAGASAPTPAPFVLPVTAWYPPAPALASDTSTLTGVTAIPGGCAAAIFGSTGEQVTQQETRLDLVFGISETETTDTWVTPTVGPVCQRINDTVSIFYDFTNQSPFFILAGGPSPIQTNAITSLMGLKTAARPSAARFSAAHGTASAGAAAGLGYPFALARERIERWRLSIRAQQLAKLRAALSRQSLRGSVR